MTFCRLTVIFAVAAAMRVATDFTGRVRALGFDPVLTIRLNDILPYPHIQYVCIKP